MDAGCGERVGRPAAAFRVFLNAEVINIVLRSTNEEGRRISGAPVTIGMKLYNGRTLHVGLCLLGTSYLGRCISCEK